MKDWDFWFDEKDIATPEASLFATRADSFISELAALRDLEDMKLTALVAQTNPVAKEYIRLVLERDRVLIDSASAEPIDVALRERFESSIKDQLGKLKAASAKLAEAAGLVILRRGTFPPDFTRAIDGLLGQIRDVGHEELGEGASLVLKYQNARQLAEWVEEEVANIRQALTKLIDQWRGRVSAVLLERASAGLDRENYDRPLPAMNPRPQHDPGDKVRGSHVQWSDPETHSYYSAASSEEKEPGSTIAVPETSSDAETSAPDILVLAEALSLLRAETDDIASAAFDAYADAMENAVETGRFSAVGIGKAMKVSVKQSLLSIGQQASIRGAFEIAEGVSSYADHDSEGGGKHMAAAGKWFAVAGLAGASAAAVGGGEGGGGGRGSSKDPKRDEIAPNGADPEGTGGSKGRVIQRITVIGNPTDGQRGEVNGKLAPHARRSAP